MKYNFKNSCILLLLFYLVTNALAQQNFLQRKVENGVKEQINILPKSSENPSQNRDQENLSIINKDLYIPISSRLERYDLSERENALIHFETPNNLSVKIQKQLENIKILWNNGNSEQAIEHLRNLENSENQMEIAVGINWKVPKIIQNPQWDTDVKISNRNLVRNACLDFDDGTGNLLAAIRMNESGTWNWAVNFSSDGGKTWYETYQWAPGGYSYKINDIAAGVLHGYFYVEYTTYSSQVRANIRRFSVTDGSLDTAYGFKQVFNKGIEILELAIATLADEYDNRIYCEALLADHSIVHFQSDENGVDWKEFSTGIIDADRGLDVCYNEKYDNFYLFISYIGTDNRLHVVRAKAYTSLWDNITFDQLTTENKYTAISAYDDHIIVVFENNYYYGPGISYRISNNGGDSWSFGTIKAPSTGEAFYGPDVTARKGGGIAVVYIEESGAFDRCWYSHRDYDTNNWSTPQQFNEIDVSTTYQLTTEWVPPLSGYGYAYGVIMIDGEFNSPYFDRLDSEGCRGIKVTSPNGSEVWFVNEPYTITWTADQYAGRVKIEISTTGGSTWWSITGSSGTDNDGSYTYKHNNQSAHCLYRISCEQNYSERDQSDNDFTYVDHSTIKRYIAKHIPYGMAEPTIDGYLNDDIWTQATISEEILQTGGTPEDDFLTPWSSFSDNHVTWKAVWSASTNLLYVAIKVEDDIAGALDNDYDHLYKDDCIELFTDGNNNGGFYTGTYVPAQQWLIRRDNIKHLGFTSGQYTGSAINSVTRKTEVGGNWILELAMTIYSNCCTQPKVLAQGDVIGWEVWYDDSDNTTIDGGKWDRDHQVGWGYIGRAYLNADAFQELELGPADPIKQITVTSPNGGEVWQCGFTYQITWTSSNISGNVKIEYYCDGIWNPIVNSTPNDGSYSWTIPQGINCNQALVKVSDALDPNLNDQSDHYFKINCCDLIVTSPNGGEMLYSPGTHNITWNPGSISGNVKIEYTTNGSISWSPIVDNTTNDGHHLWNIPGGINSSQCKVKISSINDQTCFDESNSYFTISPISCPQVLVPNCKALWSSGTTHKISWIPANQSGNVKIEYSINGGLSWNNIISSTPDNGCYDWLIPNIASNLCKIKISDVANYSCDDESDVVFTIGNPTSPYIMLTDITGSTGSTVTTDIMIGGNITPIDALGLDIVYNTVHLSFLSVQKGDLTSGWIQLDGSENNSGVVTIGGFNTAAIPVGNSGSIAKALFQVTCPLCSECDQSHLSIDNLLDDLIGMNSYCGIFGFSTCLCGDVTNDGMITAEDALCAFRIYLGGGVIPPGYPVCNNPCALLSADANRDGIVTPADALGIFNRYIKGYWEPGFCGATLAKEQQTGVHITNITLENVIGQPGDMVKCPIIVDNPDGISAFGMELNFPSDLLEFVGVSRTDITKKWIALDGKQTESGIMKLGGFNPQAISQSTSAAIAEVSFVVKEKADGESVLSLNNFTDDLSETMNTTGMFSTDISLLSPTAYKLAQNHPNPFNLETTITYHVPEATRVKVVVYNVSGQKIKILIDGEIESGSHQILWDGRDELGEVMASGIYVYKLETNNIVLSKKMILLK